MRSVILCIRYFTDLLLVVMMVAPRVKRDVGMNFFRNERSKIEKGNRMEKKRSDLRKLRSLLP